MVYYLGYQTVGEYKVNIRNLDGDPLKVEIADTTPDDGLYPTIGSTYSATSGRPIKTEFVPTKIEWQDSQPVPDVDQPFGMLSVPDKFKDIVEQIEPGVHQFLPVEFVDVDGSHLASRWFFIVCKRIDSVDREHSSMILTDKGLWRSAKQLLRRNPEQIPPDFDVSAEPKLVFNLSQIGGAHAWCDKFLLHGWLISDQLAEALMRAELSGISLSKTESV